MKIETIRPVHTFFEASLPSYVVEGLLLYHPLQLFRYQYKSSGEVLLRKYEAYQEPTLVYSSLMHYLYLQAKFEASPPVCSEAQYVGSFLLTEWQLSAFHQSSYAYNLSICPVEAAYPQSMKAALQSTYQQRYLALRSISDEFISLGRVFFIARAVIYIYVYYVSDKPGKR